MHKKLENRRTGLATEYWEGQSFNFSAPENFNNNPEDASRHSKHKSIFYDSVQYNRLRKKKHTFHQIYNLKHEYSWCAIANLLTNTQVLTALITYIIYFSFLIKLFSLTATYFQPEQSVNYFSYSSYVFENVFEITLQCMVVLNIGVKYYPEIGIFLY